MISDSETVITTYNWWFLMALCVAMQVSSYLAGVVPLSFPLSPARLRLVSALGAGLLVGTALVVIIPEGVHSIYSSSSHHHHNAGVSVAPEGEGGAPNHSLIGFMLVLGFVFMFLVDQIGGAHGRSSAPPPTDPTTTTTTTEGAATSRRHRGGMTATLGLVVHAAADGVALGAAAATAQMSVEMIIFLAIMLHKAPAAFGLVTFLLHERLEKGRIRRHLLLFSLSAPVLALLTFIILVITTSSSSSSWISSNGTGAAMLFSAGTFLYVATVHVLPEITSMHCHDPPSSTSSSSSTSGASSSLLPVSSSGGTGPLDQGMTRAEVVAIVIGALAPLIITIEHHH